MQHDSDKIFFEFLIKNILLHYNIIDDKFVKSESPDFISENIGLEITRADPTLKFDGFINKYPEEKIGNIEKFNKKFELSGGKVFRKTDAIVEILGLVDTFGYHEDYVYIIPSYKNSLDFINEKINNKIGKLNNTYKKEIDIYYLTVFTTAYINEDMIKEEFVILDELQKNSQKQFDKIIIIFLDKICIFDLANKKYEIIDNVNQEINKLSQKTKEELYDTNKN